MYSIQYLKGSRERGRGNPCLNCSCCFKWKLMASSALGLVLRLSLAWECFFSRYFLTPSSPSSSFSSSSYSVFHPGATGAERNRRNKEAPPMNHRHRHHHHHRPTCLHGPENQHARARSSRWRPLSQSFADDDFELFFFFFLPLFYFLLLLLLLLKTLSFWQIDIMDRAHQVVYSSASTTTYTKGGRKEKEIRIHIDALDGSSSYSSSSSPSFFFFMCERSARYDEEHKWTESLANGPTPLPSLLPNSTAAAASLPFYFFFSHFLYLGVFFLSFFLSFF